MLRTLDARHDRFALNAPFRISRGVKTAAEVVTVTIGQDGHIGRGEAVPYGRYGETIDGALAAIETVRTVIEAGGDRTVIAAKLPAGAARNALDCALWELEARLKGTSVALMIGQPPLAPVASAITIGLDSPEAMAAAARRVSAVPLLKVKVDATDPLAQIAAVRAAAPTPRLIVDPNESWTLDDLRACEAGLVDLRVDLLEQPLPADADYGLRRSYAVAICADESVHVAADLDRLPGAYSYVNVKLDKSGGLTEALALADAARARGFGLMVGCMVASSLGIAPALHIAASAEFVDLDGPLWLAEDRRGGVTDKAGMLSPPASGFWGEV